MGFEAPREMYELVEEKLGSRWAWWGLWAFWATLISTGLLTVGAVFYYATTRVVQPILTRLPDLQFVAYQEAILSLSVTVLLFVISGTVIFRSFKRWERALFRGIDSYVKAHTENLVSQKAVDDFDRRVSALEAHTDISGLRKALTQRLAIEGLRAAADPLMIHSACYGLGQGPAKSVDVKQALESHVGDGRIDILVTNETLKCGNPFAGETKTLFVEYSGGGHRHRKIQVKETHKLVIPEPMTLGRLAGFTP